MPSCSIVGCMNRRGETNGVSFFNFPRIKTNEGLETQILCEKRQTGWRAAVNRDLPEGQWEKTCVCGQHFVDGRPAYLHDTTNPSWLPTINLGYDASYSTKDANCSRHERRLKRKNQAEKIEAATSLLEFKNQPIEEEPNAKSQRVQTELTANHIEFLQSNIPVISKDRQNVKFSKYDREFYVTNADNIPFYTSLPNLGVFDLLFSFIVSFLQTSKVLSNEQQLLLCLVKLRMNYLFKDIANDLGVHVSTVQRCFHNTLDVLYKRVSFLVTWPERDNLQKSTPRCFLETFGKKVAVIIDCFELFCEKPSGAMNNVLLFSNYKHHTTVKFLIGVSPQGVITFISSGWGGRVSDKHIIEKSDILENLLPDDIVLADRGFKIEDEVSFYQAKLLIPNFTRGKLQLHPLEIENTRKIASVRIHVERVIGLLTRKFRFFDSIIPIEFMKLRKDDTVPTIDKIVKVCCALTNLCNSVVPFE